MSGLAQVEVDQLALPQPAPRYWYKGEQQFQVEALRLGWDTWSDMCAFADVGPDPDQARGVFIGENDQMVDYPTDVIGLLLPGHLVAIQGDYVIKFPDGSLSVADESWFKENLAMFPVRPTFGAPERATSELAHFRNLLEKWIEMDKRWDATHAEWESLHEETLRALGASQ